MEVSTFTITMPLEKNIPCPTNPNWRLMQCPVCGQNCWESDMARQVSAAYPGVAKKCTECALAGYEKKRREQNNA